MAKKYTYHYCAMKNNFYCDGITTLDVMLDEDTYQLLREALTNQVDELKNEFTILSLTLIGEKDI